jgi:uncharacterized OB-fold protein
MLKGENGAIILKIICENCGKKAILSAQTAFAQGWDYPPLLGSYTVVSPRTCGDCGIETTLWYELEVNGTPVERLSAKHLKTLERILGEPDTILPE